MTTTQPPAEPSAVRLPDLPRPVGQWRQARRTCPPGCFGYHAAWSVCRRLGIKSHPGWHQDFLTASLSSHPDAARDELVTSLEPLVKLLLADQKW